MAEIELRAGAKLDLLTPHEFSDGLEKALAGSWEGEQEARGRGIKPINIRAQPTVGSPPAAPALSATAAFPFPHTPNSGYVWALRNFAAFISAGVNTRLWYGDSASTGPTGFPICITNSGTVVNQAFSGTQVLLRAGELLVINASGAANLLGYNLMFVEVPEQLVWKLV